MRVTLARRVCRFCDIEKEISAFYKAGKRGYEYTCKECRSAKNKIEYAEKHPEAKQIVYFSRRKTLTDDKMCPRCKTIKTIEEFVKHKGRCGGITSVCRTCLYALNKTDERRKLASAYSRAHKIKWSTRFPMKYKASCMVAEARKRAKKQNLPFDIDVPFILSIMPASCPVLGIPLNYEAGYGVKYRDNSASLDKFEAGLGYVKNNVNIISWRANRIKVDATPDELLLISVWMRRMEKNKAAYNKAAVVHFGFANDIATTSGTS